MKNIQLRGSLPAFGWHLSVSVGVALLAALLVFVVWYPHPYEKIQGGFALFFLVISVDVVCGPLLTLVVFDAKKKRRELLADLGVVGLLQLGALIYGLHSVWLVRPIYLVFEVDRYRVVSLADIDPGDLESVRGYLPLPRWNEVHLLGVRVAKPEDADYLSQLKLSLSGQDAACRPSRWVSYEEVQSMVLERSKPIKDLSAKHPGAETLIRKAIEQTGFPENQLRWMPVQSRWSTGWTALLDVEKAKILGFVELDGF